MLLFPMCHHRMHRCQLDTKKSLLQMGLHALVGSEFQACGGIQVGGERNVLIRKQVPFILELV